VATGGEAAAALKVKTQVETVPEPSTEAAGGRTVQSVSQPEVTTETVAIVSTPASATGDLHIHHAGGGKTDVKGIDGEVCNLHQAANASLNARFTYANFTLAPEDPRAGEVIEVQGSFLTGAYAGFRTTTSTTTSGAAAVLVRVEFDGSRPGEAHVVVTSEASGAVLTDLWTGEEDGPLAVGRVKVQVKAATPVALIMSNDEWKYTIVPGTYRAFPSGLRRPRIDVLVAALADPLEAKVAPHGLIGQGYDGLHIEGNKDNYVPNAHGVHVTSAQGEGAIEGSIRDYVVSGADPFSTFFKFSRFDAAVAPPRDTSKLNAPIGAPKRA
jgi:hypothetical protein